MNKRVLFGLAVIAAAVAGLVLLRPGNGHQDALPYDAKGTSVSVKGGAPAASLNRQPTTLTGAAGPKQAGPRELYFSEPDRAKVFAALEQEVAPEAKYFAFRAAADCQVVLGSAADWNDIAFATASRFPSTALDRNLDPRRREALGRLAAACRGFTRPNTFPQQRLDELLAEAAGAGFPAAVAAARWREHESGKVPVDLAAFRTMGEAAFASGDFFAVREAEGVILSMRHRTPIAGLGLKDLDVLTVAFRLAECQLNSSCGASGLLSDIHCAMEAKCYDDPASYFLDTLPESERPQAQEAAERLLAAIENGSLASILKQEDGPR